MSIHKTVLLNETIEGLNLRENSSAELTIVDCTFGGGGHSQQILLKYPNVKIIALDQDNNAWKNAEEKFKGLEKRISFVNKNFRDLENFSNLQIDGMIFDLGLSSDQLNPGAGGSGRGFSFLKDEPLLMQMKSSAKENPTSYDLTAFDIVNTWSEENLAKIIYGYGEERFSRKIARAIVENRAKKEIRTTFDLVEIIKGSVPASYKRGKLHFATRTFQALRIAVNDELNTLQIGLESGFKLLKVKGRMAVISFHSLEDRIVKKFFKEKAKQGQALLINKKPIVPGKEEVKNNPRSRSAKLRILEKINT